MFSQETSRTTYLTPSKFDIVQLLHQIFTLIRLFHLRHLSLKILQKLWRQNIVRFFVE